MSAPDAILEIDLDAVVANWRMLRDRVAPATCAAVVKADAYGLGAPRVAPALASAGCRSFYVAQLQEGIALRGVLPDAEIIVLNGLMPGTEAEHIEHRLVPTLNDLNEIARWRGRGEAPAMLHLDTGLNRLGVSPKETAQLLAKPELLDRVRLRGVMSHLACSDEPVHPLNEEQRRRFAEARARLPALPASLAASSGIFLGRDFHLDEVRPGVALYGGNPLPGTLNPMRQVVRLQAKILGVRDIDPGATVGYGATHRADRTCRVATVAAGYADGLLRALSNCGHAVIAGRRVPIIGRVSMDLITLDVTGLDPQLCEPGRYAELLGAELTVDAVGTTAGTISYEMLTSLGGRYHRTYRSVANGMPA